MGVKGLADFGSIAAVQAPKNSFLTSNQHIAYCGDSGSYPFKAYRVISLRAATGAHCLLTYRSSDGWEYS